MLHSCLIEVTVDVYTMWEQVDIEAQGICAWHDTDTYLSCKMLTLFSQHFQAKWQVSE